MLNPNLYIDSILFGCLIQKLEILGLDMTYFQGYSNRYFRNFQV